MSLASAMDRHREQMEKLHRFSMAALDIYNHQYGTNYGVVEVVNSSEQAVSGFNYFITFEAESESESESDEDIDDNDDDDDDDDDDEAASSALALLFTAKAKTTFEAQVYQNIPDMKRGDLTQVTFVRLHGDTKREVRPAWNPWK